MHGPSIATSDPVHVLVATLDDEEVDPNGGGGADAFQTATVDLCAALNYRGLSDHVQVSCT